jgi:hypothetical protein
MIERGKCLICLGLAKQRRDLDGSTLLHLPPPRTPIIQSMKKIFISEEEKQLHKCTSCKKWSTMYMMIQLDHYTKEKQCIRCFNRSRYENKNKSR